MSLGDFDLSHTLVLSVVESAVKIVAIIAAAIIIMQLTGLIIDRLFLPIQGGKKYYLDEKRAKTLIALLKNILKYVMYFIAGIMILRECNIDTTSILAGAGIVGLAVGVGAQSMVKDIIIGFLIIFEDQFAVGDYITTADVSGIVEEIGLRVTKMRDLSGILHIIPNGYIGKVTNFTRGTMSAVVNIPIAYEADKSKAWKAVEEAAAEIQNELVEIIDGPKIVGFVELNSSNTILRVVAKVVPLEQVKVETRLRHRIIQKFDAADIPFITKTQMTNQ